MTKSALTFPGESKKYRKARKALLEAEIELQKRVEKVAAKRRKLPLGGEVEQDYVFDEGARDLSGASHDGQGQKVRLSELFARDQDTLLLYSFMYGPDMKRPCPMCTSFLDSINGAAPHATQRVSLAVAAKSPLPRIREFARGRGWNNLRLLSSAGSTYNLDYHGETAEGAQNPMMNVFVRRKGKVFHFWASESLFAKSRKGQDSRHIDIMWPLWNMLDLTPEGRGTDWYPALVYPPP
jgi:predicted dithiol-disulfide oxidoreductase (DUF899 family)